MTASASPLGRPDRRALLVVSLASFVVALIAWTLVVERLALTRWAAESWLSERGVESLVEIRTLDLGQFTGAIRLGDPSHPSLKVERLEVDYSLEGPLNGKPFGVRTRAVRLIRPRLTARFQGGRVTFGPLQPIIEEALKRPRTGSSPPVLIRQGVVVAMTDAGPITFAGDADLADGVLTRLDGRIIALALRGGGSALTSTGGPVWARTRGGILTGAATLDLTAASAPGYSLSGGALTITGRTIYPQPKQGRFDADGDFTVALAGATVAGAGLTAQVFNAKASIPGVHYSWDGQSLSLAGGAVAEARADRLAGARIAASSAWSALGFEGVTATASKRGVTLAGETSGSLNARSLTVGDMPLADVALGGEGSLKTADGRLYLDITARGAAVSALTSRQAARIAAATPFISGEPAYRQALARALPGAALTARGLRVALGPGGVRFALSQPARVDARSGARLVLSPRAGAALVEADASGLKGAGRLALSGGGLPDLTGDIAAFTVRGREARADLTLAAALNYGPAKGLKTTARAHVLGSPAGFRLTLADCAPLSITRLEGGEKDVVGIDARLCPEARPLVEARRGAWTAHGGAREVGGLIQLLDARAARVTASFDAWGGSRGLAGAEVRIAGAELIDAETPLRFEPVHGSGRAQLAGDLWQGDLDLAAPKGPTLGRVSFRHDLANGVGAARIDAPALRFIKDGLQPAAISPLAKGVAAADGTVAFQGAFDWTRQGVSSSGRLTTHDFAFLTPIGEAHGLSADIGLASLTPLETLPSQSLKVARIDALTPLTDVSARFDYSGDMLNLAAADATVAKGRIGLEPMLIAIGRTAPLKGVVILHAVDLGDLIAGSSLADAVKLDAVVDGRLPFESDDKGFRFVAGHLAAIRPGRISISRAALAKVDTGLPAAAAGEVNAVQDFAYQAMENLSFQSLSAEVASRAEGRLGVIFQIRGRHDPAKPEEAKISLVDLIRGKALNRRIPLPAGTPINLTLDTSLNFDELLNAFQDIWRAKQTRSAQVQGR